MTKIVSNASPIIALSRIGMLSLLPLLFDQIFMPNAVYEEITQAGILRPGAAETELAVANGVITLFTVKDQILVEHLSGKLHRGELEVIIGAKEIGLQTVLIDEKAARKLADTFLISSIGTLGILLLANQFNLIQDLQFYLDALLGIGFRINKDMYQRIQRQISEG